MSIPNHGGSSGRRPLPLSPPPAGRNGDTAETRPATVDQWPAPPVDRPGRPRFDGWAGPPPHLNGDDLAGPSGNGTGPRSRRWPLVLATLGLVAALGVAAGVVVARRGSEPPTEVGTVRSAGGARVRTAEGAERRDLEEGETVLYGWTVEAGDGSGVVIDLGAGGVLRFDEGAELTFTATGSGDEGDPTALLNGGRTWFNPAGVTESEALALATDDIRLRSNGPPMAVDCTVTCTAEAPAGGVKVSTGDGVNVAPATDEAVMVTSDGGLVIRTIDEPSPWVRENLEADAAALPPAPNGLRNAGVTAGAMPARAYALDVAVTGDGEGIALHPSLTWQRGQTAHYDAVVDAEPCPQVPCDVLVTATIERNGATLMFEGTLHIENRSVDLTLTRPVECPASSTTGVPAHPVGTSTITADLAVSEAAYDDASQDWIATVMGGPGTATVEITDPTCDTVPTPAGTRRNALEMTGHAAG
jgi:hypothetical protein